MSFTIHDKPCYDHVNFKKILEIKGFVYTEKSE